MKNLIISLLLSGIGGAALAADNSAPAETVLAMRTVEAFGQLVTLVDTKRMEAGKELYCQQHVGGAYNDPKTQKVVVQIVGTCQVGAPKDPF